MFYSRPCSAYPSQKGSVLVVVVFVLVVMGFLAIGLTQIGRSNQETTTLEVLGARAWLAAHSGNEVALQRLFPLNSSSALGSVCTSTIVSSVTMGSYGCEASVSCTSQAVDVTSSAQTTFYFLESTGTCSSGKNQVSRVQEVMAKELN
ncbi:hypothetical protein [Thaumasiovibrio subtropicus]|uniref:hypothetical protein n=1 Tax=Thaumasiovibrio subtropicus TaxID=1891207 RepID=UPI000B34FD78|nr:hypothetical protein [Thaumasiovibrio subtropicus]